MTLCGRELGDPRDRLFEKGITMSDQKYRDESYLGDPKDDDAEPEVRDLGYIVEDRHDQRALTIDGSWERLDDLDTDEALEVGEDEPLPLHPGDGEPPTDAFATLYNLDHLDGEEQEENFVETSMLATDPDGGAGADDYTSSADLDDDGRLETTDIAGHAAGIAPGFGTSIPMDIGSGGFQMRDNPLMQPQDPDQPISSTRLSDEALGLRDVDEMGDEKELERLADQAARGAEKGSTGEKTWATSSGPKRRRRS
jgi:hypothetical protein